ncbi:MAG: CBS domain-containing protein [Pseudomonadota bacterium]|uniref:CBS domain-containing protein n=1 Tax=Roseovarius TaxID=74030 RepID=UPI0022A8C47C|nr:CBS domain-containing protein [Roseovarius sp. EGI FJ00037]MCZ0813482.1 CBS domain-containing protein [Roseovarius sp. EGI FJ00037]
MVGMIADHDIALRGAGLGKTPNTMVRDAMTEDLRYCFDDEDAEAVMQNLGSQQIRRIPGVSRSEKSLVGIVSLGDIAQRGSEGDAGAALEQIAQPGGRILTTDTKRPGKPDQGSTCSALEVARGMCGMIHRR